MQFPMMPAIEWTSELRPVGPSDDIWSRLIGAVRILGVDFHVNAEAVHQDEDNCQVADCSDTYVDDIQALTDGAGRTVKLGPASRDYLLIISPYQE